jgi:hypothetical protein
MSKSLDALSISPVMSSYEPVTDKEFKLTIFKPSTLISLAILLPRRSQSSVLIAIEGKKISL